MSVSKTYHGATYLIPETKEKSWGPTVTALLAGFATDLNGLTSSIGGVSNLLFPSTTTSIESNGTLTQTYPWHRVSGTSAPVILNATTAIADGVTNGTLLLVSGNDTTNTVTILNGANTTLNGHVLLGLGDYILLAWNSTTGNWEEVTRSK